VSKLVSITHLSCGALALNFDHATFTAGVTMLDLGKMGRFFKAVADAVDHIRTPLRGPARQMLLGKPKIGAGNSF
jgi:hypothetical protein